MNAEEVELLSDSKYRNYVAAVDKALKNFEYSSEWADLISALGKLNKVMIADRPRHEIHGSSLQVIVKAKRHTWGLNIHLKKKTSTPTLVCPHPLLYVLYIPGFAEQCKIPGGSKEVDDRQAAGPMPPPRPAQWGAPESLGDLRDHLQDHWTQEAGQRPLSLQVILSYYLQWPLNEVCS